MKRPCLQKGFILFVIYLSLSSTLMACQQGADWQGGPETPVVRTSTSPATIAGTPVMLRSKTPPSIVESHQPLEERSSLPVSVTLPLSTPTPFVAAIESATPRPETIPMPIPFGGWLVFESRREDTNTDGVIDFQDGTHLYRLSLSTNELMQLTCGKHKDLKPTWSPDHSQIAFVSDREGDFELFVMNGDGSDVRRLTNTAGDETSPAWSPDGSQIAYVLVETLDSGLQEHHVWLLDIDGYRTHALLADGFDSDFDPQWSPDGRFLAFMGRMDTMKDNVHSYEDNVCLYDMQTDLVINLTLPGIPENSRVDIPRWLPRDGYFLSVIQAPGEASSLEIKVFEIQWAENQPKLSSVFVLADASGSHVWGPNGEWLISVISNDRFYPNVVAPESYDLVYVPVDFSAQSKPLRPPRFYDYSIREKGGLITDNAFYDGRPDWIP